MNDESFETSVGTPLFLVRSFEPCWKCRKEQRVVALKTRRMRTEDFAQLHADETAEPFFLTNIDEMPQPISEYLSAAHPQFQKRQSKTMDITYYANTCADCGANFGDHYLFSEPGGAFWPQSTEQAARMTVEELRFTRFKVPPI